MRVTHSSVELGVFLQTFVFISRSALQLFSFKTKKQTKPLNPQDIIIGVIDR